MDLAFSFCKIPRLSIVIFAKTFLCLSGLLVVSVIIFIIPERDSILLSGMALAYSEKSAKFKLVILPFTLN